MPESIHPRQIVDITPECVELLEAVGRVDVRGFQGLRAPDLHQELVEANATLKLAQEDVSVMEVARWLQEAELLSEGPEEGFEEAEEPAEAEPEPESVAVDYEQSEEVQAMLNGSPFALPLPGRILQEQQVPVSQIPTGILLNRYVGDLEVRINQDAPKSKRANKLGYSSRWVNDSDGPDIDMARMADGPKTALEAQGAPEEKASSEGARHSLIRAPLESTNRGKNPNSRCYIRGVLHANPFALYFGALSTLLICILVPLALAAVALLILSNEMPERLEWVTSDLLWVPAAMVLVGLVYLLIGLSGRCRVCNQKLFVYRPHLKNSRAHHLFGMGYVLPTCLHLLLFRWFRCSHCGTSIRLKK